MKGEEREEIVEKYLHVKCLQCLKFLIQIKMPICGVRLASHALVIKYADHDNCG